jgi:hypothetical protein
MQPLVAWHGGWMDGDVCGKTMDLCFGHDSPDLYSTLTLLTSLGTRSSGV